MGLSGDVSTNARDETLVVITDVDGSGRGANVVQRVDGKNAIATETFVTVLNTPGQDPLPDSHFTLINTGAEGDTITIDVAGTNADPSSPDRDLPAYQKIFIVQAGEVGDEIALVDRMVSELNADSDFDDVFLKAYKIKDRAIIQISSIKFSLNGEFYERPNAGDFDVTTTGTASVNVGFDNLISRVKISSLSRDPDNPHKIGVLGISGTVTVTPGSLPSKFIEKLKNGSSAAMNVDGSTTPVDFCVFADPTGEYDIFIQKISIHAQANGIKFGQWLAINVVLPNGIQPIIVTEDNSINLLSINTTDDLKHEFTFGDVSNFSLHIQAGRDDIVATATFDPPFPLIAGSNDEVCLRVQDNLTTTMHLETLAVGFKREA